MDQSFSSTEVLQLLTAGASSSRKCRLRLLDTIYIPKDGDLDSPQWFFTTKSGSVARKKGEKASLVGVHDRFSKFSLANPHNTDRTVGVFVHGNGYRQTLNESNLKDILGDNSSVLLQEGAHLQVFLRPHRGRDARVVCKLRQGDDGTLGAQCVGTSPVGASEEISSEQIQRQMKEYAGEIAEHLHAARGLVCSAVDVEFIVDDNEHVWLSSVSQCQLAPANGMPAQRFVDEDGDGPGEMEEKGKGEDSPTLPSVSQTNAGSGDLMSMALGDGLSPRPGTGGSRPGSGTNRPGSVGSRPASSSRPTSGGNSFSLEKQLVGGELLQREVSGGSSAFCCPLGPDDLPGLRAWALVSMGSGNLQWSIDLQEYTSGVLSPNPTVEAVRAQRSQQRHREKGLPLLVLRLGEKLLLGNDEDNAVNSAESFQMAWQAVHLQAQRSLQGFDDVEATVCGNTHAVCRKLESLCKIDFHPLETLPAGKSKSSVNRPSSGTTDSRESGSMGQLRQVNSAEGSRGKSGVAHTDDGMGNIQNVDPITLDNPFFSSDAQVVSDAQLAGSKMKGVEKRKKKGKKDTDKSFRRDAGGFDAAPNVEMIAKFAAEKERAARDVKAKQDEKRRQQAILAVEQSDPLYDGGEHNDWEEGSTGQEWPERQMKQTGGKVKAIKKSKKKGKKAKDVPEFSNDEERLSYLEGMASKQNPHNPSNAYQQFQNRHSEQWGSVGEVGMQQGSIASMMSGSEADFMLRQAQGGDVGAGLAGLDGGSVGSLVGMGGGGLAAESYASNSTFQGGGMPHMGNSLAGQVDTALRDRVQALERQLQQKAHENERKDEEIDALEGKVKKINSELTNARRTLQLEVKRLQDEKETETLQLKHSHAREMASQIVTQSGDDRNSLQKAAPSDASAAGNAQLMEQIESLRTENRRQVLKHGDERQMLQTENSSKLIQQERTLKAEISDLRVKVTLLEDNQHSVSDDARTYKAQCDTLRATVQQLEGARNDAIDTQNNLRADLKNMQQSVNASYRLESSQQMTVGVDADTQIRLHEAKSEARSRQLGNKVDFLKAQLAAEQASGEEMRGTIAGHRQKIEEMRDEFRLRTKEIEAGKQGAIEDAERRIEEQFEGRMAELTTLQTKMKMMQGQLQDAFSDGSLLKQREEAAKLAASKAQSAQSILRAEIEQLRQQVIEARELKEQAEMESGNKQSSDAVIRRLDNERQYLKSQLASEITHKNEMQSALAKCQHQLNDVNKQWKADVNTLKETSAIETQDAANREQILSQRTITLQGEHDRLDSANKDLKEAFLKMRDQVRMEQLSMENALSVNRRLQEQFELTKSELNRMRDQEEETDTNHQREIEALKSTMDEQDSRRQSELHKFKEDLAAQYNINSESQQKTLVSRNEFQAERRAAELKAGAMSIVKNLQRWQRQRLSSALRKWCTNATLVGVAKQFRSHVNDLVDDTVDEKQKEKEEALHTQHEEMLAVQSQRDAELREEFARTADQIRDEERADKDAALDSLGEEMRVEMQATEEKWVAAVEEARMDGERNTARATEQAEVKMDDFSTRCQADLDSALEDSDRRVKDANTQKEMADQMITRLKTQLKEFEDSHNKSMVELMAEHTLEKKKSAKESGMERETLLEKAAKEQRQAVEQQLALLTAQRHDLEKRLLAEREEAENQVKESYEDMIEDSNKQNFKDQEARVRELKDLWEEEKVQELVDRDTANEKLLGEKMETYAKSVEFERVRAVKLESSKWRQALKDAEHRFELETSKAKAEGRAEQKKEDKELMGDQDNSQKMAILKLQEDFEKEKAHLHTEHQHELLLQEKEQERLKQEALMKTKAMTEEMLGNELKERVAEAIDETWKDANELWQKKLEKQEGRLDNFKSDVAAQSQQMAQERNDLQTKNTQNEEIIARMEALNRQEAHAAQKEHDAQLNLMNLKFEKAKKIALKELSEEQADTLDSVEVKYKEIADRRVIVERGKLEEDMNKQIAQLQVESESLISGLEAAVSELKQEKTKLETSLESQSNKLEDTEDTLFDLQQSEKKRGKDNAMLAWRQIITQQKMKERFEDHIDNLEKDSEERERLLERDLMNEQNEMILAALKLAALLADLEDQRKSTHKVLTSYRTAELLEKRTLIRVLEKEFERLTMEKDAMEEQRDLMEEEIEDLEGQVRGMEEEIREHSRTSSMQNGRINVSHARKKRRLDADLERVLEQIENKRVGMGEMDERGADKARERDTKEQEMVELEKEVVGILVEQQRKVLSKIDLMKGAAEDKCRLVLSVARLPWPPPEAPSIEYVQQMQSGKANKKEAELKAQRDQDN